jgi:hypothetical protein
MRKGVPAQRLYYPGIGFVPEGRTGSTFEGLWLCGVCEALKAIVAQPDGADADHIMVKRGRDGLDRARNVLLAAARRYSFFTIDVSDILDYSALQWRREGRQKRARLLQGAATNRRPLDPDQRRRARGPRGENAREGSTVAADCLKQYESEPESDPHPKFDLFRLFCDATVGRGMPQGTSPTGRGSPR